MRTALLFSVILMGFNLSTASAIIINVDGVDAIFLAGRTDVTIPPLGSSDPSFPLLRHPFVSPGFLQEQFPEFVSTVGVLFFKFSASGGVDYNPSGANFIGPEGHGNLGSVLDPLGGISGYKGPEGPLVGVFLDDSVPSGGPPPPTLDFTPSGMGTAFLTLSPLLGQVFYIGDGLSGHGDGMRQRFIPPPGATRLFLGIVDGFAFDGPPGFYEDDNGLFRVSVNQVPEPSTTTLIGLGLLALFWMNRNRRAS